MSTAVMASEHANKVGEADRTDEFQALEQKVLRAVEIVRRERDARAAAEAEAASLREQLAAQTTVASSTSATVKNLENEREDVRRRVEKMLAQMDELL